MVTKQKIKSVLVTGGAGYVGSALVPKLLAADYEVSVLDLFLFGDHVLDSVREDARLTLTKGDIRDRATLADAVRGVDAVIHLACISNDPSFELDPELGKSINYDAFIDLVNAAERAGVSRFVYASSSSVYGVKQEENVTENLRLEPLTDYSKYKALCEDVLLAKRRNGFVPFIIRPATVCGYSPRMRLDLTVNILTNHAINRGRIKVFGGDQVRPNIHIDDMTDLYLKSLGWPDAAIDGKIYNVGRDNRSVMDIARTVRRIVGREIVIERVPTDDNRSYRISSEGILRDLNFAPERAVENAISDVASAFHANRIPDPLNAIEYYNVKLLQSIGMR